VLGPPILSRALLNPQVNKWLTTGYMIPPSSPTIGGYASRIIGAIYRANEEYQAMRDRQEKD